jgi:tRNA threonylcarbamoyladenosine biosynthesis protein TsaE
MEKIISENTYDTKKVAEKIISNFSGEKSGATVLALEGDLGTGKTTLTQYITEALGSKDEVLSPTFVLMKEYKNLDREKTKFKKIIHIDTYRFEDKKEIEILGWKNLIKEKDILIIVEWPEIISDLLPEGTYWIKIKHLGGDSREFEI